MINLRSKIPTLHEKNSCLPPPVAGPGTNAKPQLWKVFKAVNINQVQSQNLTCVIQ